MSVNLHQTPLFGARDRGAATAVALEPLTLEVFVVCDGPEPYRASPTCNCPRGESCPNRAYLTVLYANQAQAERAVDSHARALSRTILPNRERTLTSEDPLGVTVARLRLERMYGRDYRGAPCGIFNALASLREGTGEEPAWEELRTQRELEEAEGTVLAGPGATAGVLFLFVAAANGKLTLEPVKTVPWRYRD